MNILKERYGIGEKLIALGEEAEQGCWKAFGRIEAIQEQNQLWVLDCFRQEQVAPMHFAPSYGYGYDDPGREKLEKLFARVFQGEKALVRPSILSGTHALCLALQGLTERGTRILSASGTPYDTLEGIIGCRKAMRGSLCDMGATYEELPLQDGHIDWQGLKTAAQDKDLILLQRSRGYQNRPSLCIDDIRLACEIIRGVNGHAVIFVDNCYGEFVEEEEPLAAGADIIVGSLIKNAGGGLAPTGAYIIGKGDLIDRIADRMTAPGVGGEIGSYAAGYLPFFQGLFLAPQTVAQALKGAVFTAAMLEKIGYAPSPRRDEKRGCIIQSVCLGEREKLITFCRALQAVSPVDSFAKPYPAPMPGYDDEVIMAAGTFIQGASVELSGDAPLREPYMFYMQGGLVYAQVKAAVLYALQQMEENT